MKSSKRMSQLATLAGQAGRAQPLPPAAARGKLIQRWSRRLIHAALARITSGTLVLEEGDRYMRFGERTDAALQARVIVHDARLYRQLLSGGTVAAGRAYMEGLWSCPDLVALVRVMARNMAILQRMDRKWARAGNALDRLRHRFNANTRRRARHNIAAHYDLSNAFFETFLDPTMMYSSALFEYPEQSLAEASRNKLEVTCRRLQLQPGDHLLEIGTGWGSLAIHAARHHGCRVTTTTLSREQYEYTCRWLREEGLSDRVTVLLRDYRELSGHYDKLVSIEMIEAVGHEYFATFFQRCNELLRPDGLMLIQAITISDQRYEQALRNVDFIQRYIFPGGCLPSNSVIARHVAEDTDMQIIGLTDITADYALTLEHWRRNFLAHAEDLAGQGFSDAFLRMWHYYLAYCQGGFTERVIHAAQFLMAKPRFRGAPIRSNMRNAIN